MTLLAVCNKYLLGMMPCKYAQDMMQLYQDVRYYSVQLGGRYTIKSRSAERQRQLNMTESDVLDQRTRLKRACFNLVDLALKALLATSSTISKG